MTRYIYPILNFKAGLAMQVQVVSQALGQNRGKDHSQREPLECVQHHHDHDAYIGKIGSAFSSDMAAII